MGVATCTTLRHVGSVTLAETKGILDMFTPSSLSVTVHATYEPLVLVTQDKLN